RVLVARHAALARRLLVDVVDVAALALHDGVAAAQRELGALAVKRLARRAGLGVGPHLLAATLAVTREALIVLELAAVRLAVLVAAHAAALDVEPLELRRGLAAVAVATGRLGMLAGQIEPGVGEVVELKTGLPAALRVTSRARSLQLLEPRAVL